MPACRLIVLLAINLVPVGRGPKEAKVIGGGGFVVVCDSWVDLWRQRKREDLNGNSGWRRGSGGRESTVLLGEERTECECRAGGRIKTLSENETQVEMRYAGMEL